MSAGRRIRYASRARRDIRRLDPPVRRRVVLAIEQLAEGGLTADVRKLKGSSEHRLRIGDWRVRFQLDAAKREIVVLRVLPRGRAYRR